MCANPLTIVADPRRNPDDLYRDVASLLLSKRVGSVMIETVDADGRTSTHSVAARTYGEYAEQMVASGVQRIELLVVGNQGICLYEAVPR